MLDWQNGIKFFGWGENTGIPIYHTVTISDTHQIKVEAFVHNNDSLVSADQDCKFGKTALSVTYVFKTGKSVGNLLFSVGIQSSDQITVTTHKSIFHIPKVVTHGIVTLDITIYFPT